MYKSTHKICLILFLLVGFGHNAYAQEVPMTFKLVGTEAGLSQSSISGITQDPYGFLWVGTQDGLNRYDGYEFKTYRNKANIKNSISDSYILCLLTDSKGNVWAGTEMGLNRFDYENEHFIQYLSEVGNTNSLDHNHVFVLHESGWMPGVLWVGTKGGLNKIDLETDTVTRYGFAEMAKEIEVYHLITCILHAKSDPDVLWIGTNHGLFQMQIASGKFRQYTPVDYKTNLSNDYVNALCEDSKGNIWVGTNQGLNRYVPETSSFKVYVSETNNPNSISSDNIRSIFEDKEKNLWIGTIGGGLNQYHPLGDNFSAWKKQVGNPNSLADNEITQIFEDRSGILWLGTGYRGLNYAIPSSQLFKHYFHNPSDPNSLGHQSVRSVMVDREEQLWIGTDGGLTIYNPKTKNYTNLFDEDFHPTRKANYVIRALFQSADGRIWIGTRYTGLFCYDPQTKIFEHYPVQSDNPDGLSSENIRCIIQDPGGMIWIGTVDGGLNRLNPKTGKFKRYLHDPNNDNSLNDNRVYHIIRDQQGLLWMGTGGGLIQFDPVKELFTRYVINPEDTTAISHHLVMCVQEDSRGRIWAGTYGGGLNLLDKATGTFTHYIEADGLPNNTVYGILEDEQGFLWISTNNGITRFDPFLKTFLNFTAADGLQDNEFNAGAHFKHNNELYFGGLNGLNSFLPEEIALSGFNPPLVLTEIQIANQILVPSDILNRRIVLRNSLLHTQKIVLKHHEDPITISFAALDFSSPGKNQYAYRLEGRDNDWNEAGNRRFVTYSSLPPKRYTFLVKGTNGHGVWSTSVAQLDIIIRPPWYSSIFFMLPTGILLLLITYLIIRQKNEKVKQDKTRLEQIVADRTEKLKETIATKDKLFSLIAHDLTTPFNTILGYSNLLLSDYDQQNEKQRKKYLKQIDQSAQSAFNLLGNLLTWARSQLKAIKLEPSNQNLRSLVTEAIKPYLGSANKKDIGISVNISADLQIFADLQTITIVVGNLCNNAIKFSNPGGTINFEAKSVNSKIELTINDYGVGMSPSQMNSLFSLDKAKSTPGTASEKGTGLGMIICKEFVENNNGRINVNSKVGSGTSIRIILPGGA